MRRIPKAQQRRIDRVCEQHLYWSRINTKLLDGDKAAELCYAQPKFVIFSIMLAISPCTIDEIQKFMVDVYGDEFITKQSTASQLIVLRKHDVVSSCKVENSTLSLWKLEMRNIDKCDLFKAERNNVHNRLFALSAQRPPTKRSYKRQANGNGDI